MGPPNLLPLQVVLFGKRPYVFPYQTPTMDGSILPQPSSVPLLLLRLTLVSPLGIGPPMRRIACKTSPWFQRTAKTGSVGLGTFSGPCHRTNARPFWTAFCLSYPRGVGRRPTPSCWSPPGERRFMRRFSGVFSRLPCPSSGPGWFALPPIPTIPARPVRMPFCSPIFPRSGPGTIPAIWPGWKNPNSRDWAGPLRRKQTAPRQALPRRHSRCANDRLWLFRRAVCRATPTRRTSRI